MRDKPKSDKPVEILVVEDSPTQAEQLAYILNRHGYRVSVAHNGREALALLRVRKPTVVITDVMMPEMGGYELCCSIRREKNLKDLPVILLSSLSDAEDVIRGLECGADNFITKPYDEAYLISRIEYIFANWYVRSPVDARSGIEVNFGGKKHFITADRQQVLNLLLSTYETAVQRNQQLMAAQENLRKLNERLEDRVRERTAALSAEVAERKRAENEVRQLNTELERRVLERTAELERANKELEAFSYSVSHDLRAPLRAISAYTQFLAEDCAPQLQGDASDYLRRISEAAKRMNQIIEDLLKLFGVTGGTINRRPVDLSAIATAVLEEFKQSEPARSVETNVAPGVIAECDESLLRVVLQNLLGNAWKFSAKKERAYIEFGVGRQNGKNVFFVRDNGAGFDMENAQFLFVPFQRLHSGTEFSGTGVGLATVKKIILRHGGEIWAESVKGEGATFYFTLG